MPDSPDPTQKLIDERFRSVSDLSQFDHALLIFGAGSGELIDRVVQHYGPRSKPLPETMFADWDTMPEQRLPIWVVDPDTEAVDQARRNFDWTDAETVHQLRFFIGPGAMQKAEEAIADPYSAQLTHWIVSPDTHWPPQELQSAIQSVQKALVAAVSLRINLVADREETQERRYASHTPAQRRALWRERFREGNAIKVLCLGARFATFVGHSMSSLARGFERLGHQVVLLQEPSDVQRVKIETIQKTVNEFDPDLIVAINYPRMFYGRKGCHLDGVPYCCWFQDPPALKELHMDDTRENRSELDFYFSCMKDWSEETESAGYGPTPVYKVPTDDELYCPEPQTPDERERYGCDISCISTIDSDTVALVYTKDCDSAPDRTVALRLDVYYKNLYRLTHGEPPLLPRDYEAMLLKFFNVKEIPQGARQELEDMMLLLESQPGRLAFRSAPLVWLSEAGYDLTLYGKGWNQHPILSKHHRGTIPYGKPLAAMLRASTMHLCTHGIWTLTMKVLDSLAAGTLPLVHWVPPERDADPISQWFEEDRDIVLFRSKEELLDKARFYFDHPEERQKVTARGREITLRHFTYVRLAENMLSTIRSRLSAD